MFLGGMTFMLFYHLLKGDWRALKINTEFRWYVGFLLFFCGVVSWILWKESTYAAWWIPSATPPSRSCRC